MRFRGGPEGGPVVEFDGARETAPSPVDAILIALASCSALDVLEILEKMRTPACALDVQVRFSRAETPPRRLTDVHLQFRVATACAHHHVERAITLSLQKYCSVAASLAADVAVSWQAEIIGESCQ